MNNEKIEKAAKFFSTWFKYTEEDAIDCHDDTLRCIQAYADQQTLQLQSRIKELEDERKWISVEDELPEKNGYYIVWCDKPSEHGLVHYHKNTGWQNGFYNDRVTHWKLLLPPTFK